MRTLHRLKEELRIPVNALRRIRGRAWRSSDLAFARPTFSQFGEDVFLREHFGPQTQGFYVDVGALDPFVGSNTLLLHRSGWSGINIEPDPAGWRRFERHRPSDINLQCAIGVRSGSATLVRDGSFSGLEGENYLWSGKAPDAQRIDVEVRTLVDVFGSHLGGRAIDLLCVDCEGGDLDVLMSNDWNRFRPRVVIAEQHAGHPRASDPVSYLVERGYVELVRLGPSVIMATADPR